MENAELQVKQELPWIAPVHEYIWGWLYEIRDQYNRPILRFQVLKGDVSYRKNLEAIIKVVAGLMNGDNWIESSANGYNLAGFTFEKDNSLAASYRPLATVHKTNVGQPLPGPVVPLDANDDGDQVIVGAEKISHESIVAGRTAHDSIVDEEDLTEEQRGAIEEGGHDGAVIGGARAKPAFETSMMRGRGDLNSSDLPEGNDGDKIVLKKMGRPKGSKNKK